MSSIAYLFPGQGAQAVGMGKAFYDAYEESRDVYKRANHVLSFDLTALCFEGPKETLTQTARCQQALFVTALAGFAAFQRVAGALTPVTMAGLSLGELTALTAANVMTFHDGLYVVQARGEAMEECAAKHKGAMLAVIGLADDALKDVCAASGATGANYNAPEQVVLSGSVRAIEQAEALAKEKGAKRALRLDVAGAFHSSLMQPAAELLKTALTKIELRPPRVPVISNVTGEGEQDPAKIRELLVQQIVSPVQWEDSVRCMQRAGATHFLEFPPARVLTGLLRRIDRTATGIAIDAPKDFEKLSDLLDVRQPS